jgi:hypothetical protein
MQFVSRILARPTASRSTVQRARKPANLATLRHFWQEHGIALIAYMGLSIGLTWPLIRDFTTAVTGVGDARHHLWILWHTKQALLGHEPLFRTSLLYYPQGITLLTHSLGPVAGLFALPFWLWGPEAAYNGALLVGFWLTGYCMYLLARGISFEPGVSFFAGTVLLVAPRHLAGIHGHLTGVFLGALPLALLGLHRALDLKRSRWWAVATASALLLALLYSSEQFVFGGMAVGFFAVAALLRTGRAQRWRVLQRCAVVAASIMVLTGPILVAILSAASDPAITVGRSLESFLHQPDLIQFFVPASFTSRLLGPAFFELLQPYVRSGLETAVFMSWIGLLLCLSALISGNRLARHWLLFTLFCVVLALGPSLLVLGKREFTAYELPIILPYAFLTSLPGLEFLRSPGRFMSVGVVGLGIAASFGLDWLARRSSIRLRRPIILLAVALVLLENWPQPWPQEKLRTVPQFYQQIAQDDEPYGVFDLPIRPSEPQSYDSWYIYYSSYYQMYQMTHGKGIASGYVSRAYDVHPLFGHIISEQVFDFPLQENILVNGRPASRYANLQFELARHGYRYVVFHKPQDQYPEYKKGSWGELVSEQMLEEVFGEQAPLVDDELTTVYEVVPMTDTTRLVTTIALRDAERWARSPATFYVASPRPESARLEVTLSRIYDPQSQASADGGRLDLQSANGISTHAHVYTDRTASLPLPLLPGSQTITLTLRSGSAPSHLKFKIRSINLQTGLPLPDDLLIDGQPQQSGKGQVLVAYGTGWYDPETWDDSGFTWRWAQSPSQLFIYSPVPQQVGIRSVPGALHDPISPSGVGSQGTLLARINNEDQHALAVQVGQPFRVDVMLEAGWNLISFELEAGSFRPIDVQPGNADRRSLSFALRGIDILRR